MIQTALAGTSLQQLSLFGIVIAHFLKLKCSCHAERLHVQWDHLHMCIKWLSSNSLHVLWSLHTGNKIVRAAIMY